MTLCEDVIDAHGGLARWQKTHAITLHVNAGGLAFASKGQRRALHGLRATVRTTGQSITLDGRGWSESFDAAIPRPTGLRWSTRDIAAFAATALWTYTSLPFVLPELDVAEVGSTLVVDFPPHLRTHSPRQVLHIGPDALIRRHDYTALDFGRWATARQDLSGYRDVDGFRIATRRRVRPQRWPHRPLLVWIDVHGITTTAQQSVTSDSQGDANA